MMYISEPPSRMSAAPTAAIPRGVLVSKGQTATTYDPEGLLAFGRTYYWRIDEVGAGPDFTIYKGPVLDFTTEAYAYPITTKIIATASSAQNDMGPEKTVDGSGLDKNDGHSTEPTDMWLSTGRGAELDSVSVRQGLYPARAVGVELEPNDRATPGLRRQGLSRSSTPTDGTTWTPLAGVPEFARAPGQPGYTAQHHGQLRRGLGQVRQADDQQELGRHDRRPA